MRKFEIGDKVFCFIFGKGKVKDVTDNKYIIVRFPKPHGPTLYSTSGKFITIEGYRKNKTLFFADENPQIKVKKINPRPFEVDDKVYCLMFGEGKVTIVSHACGLLAVDFEKRKVLVHGYNTNGTYYTNSNKTLYHLEENPKIITNKFKKRENHERL